MSKLLSLPPAEAALKSYLKEIALSRLKRKVFTRLECNAIRIRLITFMTARMVELNGSWDMYSDIRLQWAFEYCRWSEDGGEFRIQNEDAILLFINGEHLPESMRPFTEKDQSSNTL